MDADEKYVVDFLKSYSSTYVGLREISRRAAGRRRFSNEPNWAVPVIARLMERKLVEGDATGHYRLKKKDTHKQQWISPQVKKILEEHAKKMGQVLELGEDGQEISQPAPEGEVTG